MNDKGTSINIILLSDTHGHIDKNILAHAAEVDEIWHAGDIGNMKVIDSLKKIKPVIMVSGNIDDDKIKREVPKEQYFKKKGIHFFMIHIVGYAGHLPKKIREKINSRPTDILICGHSHLLRVGYDSEKLLCMNPGAAGTHGFHKIRTMLNFKIQSGKIKYLRVIELGKRGKLQTT